MPNLVGLSPLPGPNGGYLTPRVVYEANPGATVESLPLLLFLGQNLAHWLVRMLESGLSGIWLLIGIGRNRAKHAARQALSFGSSS